MSITVETPSATELTPEEGSALFDRAAREELGVEGSEFLRRLDEGSVPREWSEDAICRLEILLPFAR